MTALPLVVRNKSTDKFDELLYLKRAYNCVVIFFYSYHVKELLKNLENFSPSTLEMTFVNLNAEAEDSFANFLNSNGKLEKLMIDNCDMESFNNPSTLSSLKSLTVKDSSWLILKMFPLCKNMQRLKIDAPSRAWMNLQSDKNNLTALMAGQEELETLAITNYFPLDNNAVIDAKYNLKQLSVRKHRKFRRSSIAEDKIESDARFVQIMKRHKDTLENLEICVEGENFMEFIMKNLKVRRLFVTADVLPTNRQVYIKTRPNLHLKKLIISRKIKNSEALQGLIRTYPTIESLIIKNWMPNVINDALVVIASTLNSLTFLHIPMLTLNTPYAPMPYLRTFNVDDIRTLQDVHSYNFNFRDRIESFLTFCLNIPSVEYLTVNLLNENDFTPANIQIMTSRLTQLRHIKFDWEFNLTSAILNIFSRNCRQLRLIEMHNNSDGPKNNVKHDKVQVIYFSERFDPRVFKEEETLWDKIEDKNADELDTSGEEYREQHPSSDEYEEGDDYEEVEEEEDISSDEYEAEGEDEDDEENDAQMMI